MTSINTVEVVDKPIGNTDTVSELEEALRDIGIANAKAFSTHYYTLDCDLEEVPGLVHHDVTQSVFINRPLETEQDWDFAIRVDYKPGVTDNSARVLKSDIGLVKVDKADVYTSNVHYVKGKFNTNLKDLLERVASNPQIHDISILTKQEFKRKQGFERKIHPVILPERPNFFWIDLCNMSHEELLRTGKLGTLNTDLVKPGMSENEIDELRGGTLALKEDYLLKIKDYSLSELNTRAGRTKGLITDTELEALAQMWSEHCRHSIYNALIPGVNDSIFNTYIKKPTLEVLRKKPHLGVSIYKDNSGVFQFNEKWNILIKNETHNSPSALDPYGGSITGIVGVNRDPAGTGLGGEVIWNFLFYYLGHVSDRSRYFKDKTLETLLLNPKQTYDGVVKGVQDGGNKMGIPINLGICQYHNRNNGKPLVGVGSGARMPRFINGKPSHEKHIDVGDRLYIIGGRAGKDGIHGATFSSEELSQNSPATAVQIGDPYTQRKTFEALLELRDKGYIKFVTDLGAGGVSCAALEMGANVRTTSDSNRVMGGIEIDLDKLLFKYAGMTGTEKFLNESQERMAIAVDKKYSKEIEAILRKHEVEFSDIGCFTDSGRAIVYSGGEEVVNLDMEFIHHGYPQRTLEPAEYRLSFKEQDVLKKELDEILFKEQLDKDYIKKQFYDMLKRPNLGSVAPFMDKMDSTVKGLSVQHCIQGKGRISTSTSCILPDNGSIEGLIQSYGHAERQSYIDAEKMGVNAFLRSIGNTVAMGGRLDYMVATDQALWQSSDQPEYQQMLIEANRGMARVIKGCKIPVISGKDTMFNQATVYDEKGNVVERGVFPTLHMNTLAKIDDIDKIVTIDAKSEGNLVYVVGSTTKPDMGGSELYNMLSEKACKEFNIGQVSDEDIADVYDTFKRMNKANEMGLLQSANYIEAGGLVIAIKETATAGELGIDFDLSRVNQVPHLKLHELMYGETEGRYLVTIKPENKEKFEKLFKGKYSQIGIVKGDNFVMKQNGNLLLEESIDDLLPVYHKVTKREVA